MALRTFGVVVVPLCLPHRSVGRLLGSARTKVHVSQRA